MGNPTEHLHDFITVEAPVGPGELLARAREKRRLSVQAIAEQLHLNVGVVQALEADDYEQLPPSTFVKGYLRGYANLVDVEEDDVLEAFRGLNGEDRHRPITVHTSKSVSTEVSTATLRRVTWAVVVVLVLLVGLWARGHIGGLIARFTSPQAATSTPETSVVAKRGQITHATKSSPKGKSVSESTVASTARTPRTEVSSAKPSVAPPAATPKSSTADTGGGQATTVSPSRGASQESPSMPTAEKAPAVSGAVAAAHQAPVPAAEGASQGAASTPHASAAFKEAADKQGEAAVPQEAAPVSVPSGPELELQVAGPSWIEVTDNTGRRLVYQLVKGPADLKLHGVPPFNVSIGDTTQVKLRYAGQVVDLAPYTRQRVAHLRLPLSQ